MYFCQRELFSRTKMRTGEFICDSQCQESLLRDIIPSVLRSFGLEEQNLKGDWLLISMRFFWRVIALQSKSQLSTLIKSMISECTMFKKMVKDLLLKLNKKFDISPFVLTIRFSSYLHLFISICQTKTLNDTLVWYCYKVCTIKSVC